MTTRAIATIALTVLAIATPAEAQFGISGFVRALENRSAGDAGNDVINELIAGRTRPDAADGRPGRRAPEHADRLGAGPGRADAARCQLRPGPGRTGQDHDRERPIGPGRERPLERHLHAGDGGPVPGRPAPARPARAVVRHPRACGGDPRNLQLVVCRGNSSPLAGSHHSGAVASKSSASRSTLRGPPELPDAWSCSRGSTTCPASLLHDPSYTGKEESIADLDWLPDGGSATVGLYGERDTRGPPNADTRGA